MILVPVPPASVGLYWPWVRAGLAQAIHKSRDHYLPEDAWAPLREQKAFLYLVQHGEENIGFLILQQNLDADGLCLHVFAMWVEKNAGMVYREKLMDLLRELKTKCNAKRVTFRGRKGWQKLPGMRVVSHNYELE